jgi:hypothetical protein
MLQDNKDLSELLLLQRIIKVENSKLYLENGTTLTFKSKEDDRAYADGYWLTPDNFEGLITSVKYEHKYDWNRNNSEVTITLYHNQNELAQAEAYAQTDNPGYYFSVIEVNVETVNGKDVFTLLDTDDGKDFTQTDDETNTYVDKPLLDNDILKTLKDDVEVTK